MVDCMGIMELLQLDIFVGELDLFPRVLILRSQQCWNAHTKQPATKGAGLETLGAYQVVQVRSLLVWLRCIHIMLIKIDTKPEYTMTWHHDSLRWLSQLWSVFLRGYEVKLHCKVTIYASWTLRKSSTIQAAKLAMIKLIQSLNDLTFDGHLRRRREWVFSIK